jgi:predicted  nucleic acid-binding Zn-ribbon protein
MAKTKGTFVVPRNFDHEGKRFATKVNESIAQLKGELGDPLDGAVTFRDLIDAGLAKRDIRIGSNGQIVGTNSNDITFGDENVLDTPPAPTGVSADGAFQNIIIEWDVPTFFGFSHAEVWVATTDTFADRVFVGQTTAAVFSHQVGNDQTRYYWIRFVNIQDTVGPFNSTTGTEASTAPDIAALMTELSEDLSNLPGYQTLIADEFSGIANDISVLNNSTTRVIKSTSAPTQREDATSLQATDVWIDTDDNNQVYVRNAGNTGWLKSRDSSLVTLVGTSSFTGSDLSSAMASAQSDIITATSTNTSQATAITNLQSDLSTAEGDITTNASAISSLGTRVTTAEGNITSITSDVTTLQNDLSTAEGDISTNASAISGLQTQITANDGDISSISSSITSLTSDLSSAEGNITSNATAISSLQTTVTSQGTSISSNATAISSLQSTTGDNSANITTLQTATTNLQNDASASYVLKVEANGSVSGMVLEANAFGAGAGSAVQFTADKFAIWNGSSGTAPFIVSGGTVFIDNARIQNGAITNAKIGSLAVDDAKIANLSATKITSDQIDTARINVAGLITAGGLIVGSDLSTNGSTTIHGGNIITNTIAANKLTITPLEAGQAAADINSNTTTIDGGKITTNTVSATQINTTNLFLPSFGGEKTGTTLGYWNENDLNYRHVAEIGSGSGFYTGYIRVYKGSFAGQIKTISFLISDGTFGTSSSFNVNTSVTFSDTTKVLESASHAILVTPDLQYLSGGWIADSRLTTGKDSSNIPLSFRYTGSGTLNIFIYAQGDSNTQYMGGADARFVHFST